jgi:hypothetical protein
MSLSLLLVLSLTAKTALHPNGPAGGSPVTGSMLMTVQGVVGFSIHCKSPYLFPVKRLASMNGEQEAT